MLGLRDLQLQFAEALFDGANGIGVVESNIVSNGIGASERVEIYRNNLREGFIKALEIGFPVLERLVGVDYFRQLALEFLRAHPSGSGNLHYVGAPLASFLQERFAGTDYAYLADVAALEWGCEEVLIAADGVPISLDALREVDPSYYDQLHFELHPASALVRSAYPIVHIWRANQLGVSDEGVIDLRAGGDHVVVLRGAEGVELHTVPAGDFAVLDSFARGLALGAALEAAQAVDVDFDLGAALRRFVSLNLLVGFHT